MNGRPSRIGEATHGSIGTASSLPSSLKAAPQPAVAKVLGARPMSVEITPMWTFGSPPGMVFRTSMNDAKLVVIDACSSSIEKELSMMKRMSTFRFTCTGMTFTFTLSVAGSRSATSRVGQAVARVIATSAIEVMRLRMQSSWGDVGCKRCTAAEPLEIKPLTLRSANWVAPTANPVATGARPATCPLTRQARPGRDSNRASGPSKAGRGSGLRIPLRTAVTGHRSRRDCPSLSAMLRFWPEAPMTERSS